MSFFQSVREIHITFAGRTDQGQKRRDNQDNFVVADLDAGDLDAGFLLHGGSSPAHQSVACRLKLGSRGALLLVADGMGGAAAGATASRLAVAWIYQWLATQWGNDRLTTPEQFALRLRESMEEANGRIFEQAQRNPEFHGMGTTATAVGILDDYLFLGQVGDSRAYLFRKGQLVQLTRDQSLVQQLIDAGTMTEDEAERSAHGTVILQALGTQPGVQVDLTYQQLRRGDILLVCSDGLTRMVKRDELAEAADTYADPADLCTRLIDLANFRGGLDNITLLAARFDGAGLQDPTGEDVVGRKEYRVSAG